jgi:hypothetical protein
MEMIKKVLVVLIFLLIVALAWVGFSIYYQSVEIDVNSNATTYTKPISNTFDTDTIEEVTDRTEESFPVSPQEFLKLNQLD